MSTIVQLYYIAFVDKASTAELDFLVAILGSTILAICSSFFSRICRNTTTFMIEPRPEEHFRGIASIANRFDSITHIELEPYHALGDGKYRSLGLEPHLFHTPDEREKAGWLAAVQAATDKEVRFA